jgi:hypothetical protein
MAEQRVCRIVYVIAFVALVLRVGAFIALHAWNNPNPMEHHIVAENILRGHGFAFREFGYFGPSSVQSPTYPFIMTGLFWLFGIGSKAAYVTAMVLNSVVGSATIVLVYLLARTLGGSWRVGLLAAGACAVLPTQVYLPSHVQAIALNTAGMTAMMILFYRAATSGRVAQWLGFSVVGALTALTEPALLPILALSTVLIIFWCANRRTGLRNAAIHIAVVAAIIGPWSIRNRIVQGAWVPVKGSFWVNVWKGNNDYATGTDRLSLSEDRKVTLRRSSLTEIDAVARDPVFDAPRQYDKLTPEQLARIWGKNDQARELAFKEWTIQWIRLHPERYLQLCMIRLGKTLWIEWDNPKGQNLVYVGSRTVLLALSMIGLVLARRRGWRLAFPCLLAGSCLVLYTLTLTAARFALPFEPLQCCFAAVLVDVIMVRMGWYAEPVAAELPTEEMIKVV